MSGADALADLASTLDGRAPAFAQATGEISGDIFIDVAGRPRDNQAGRSETSLPDHRADSDDPARRLRRRTLLLEASSALAVVAAAPVLEVPRVTGAARPWRGEADLAIVNYTE